MKRHLFYTLLAIFAGTSVITLAGVVGLLPIEPLLLKTLSGALLVETAAAIVGLFKATNFFESDHLPSVEPTKRTGDSLQDALDAALSEIKVLKERNDELRANLDRRTDLEKRVWVALNAADQVTLQTVYSLVDAETAVERQAVQTIVGHFLEAGRLRKSLNSGHYCAVPFQLSSTTKVLGNSG